jgi:hypothetical protein
MEWLEYDEMENVKKAFDPHQNFLASKNLIHRDLAARNVLLDMHMVSRVGFKNSYHLKN